MQRILTFYQQKITVFAYLVGIYLMSWGLNDDVKLTKFSTTGPRFVKNEKRTIMLVIADTENVKKNYFTVPVHSAGSKCQ